MAPPRAVVLDFDGVVLESVDVKTRAFEALFAPEGAEAARRIVDYHIANGGISRFEKFRWAYREILRRPLTEEQERALGDRFNALVEDAVAVCDWVPGAREFLQSARWPLFVASGTPEEELRRIVERRGLSGRFRAVYGAPTKKAEILRCVAGEVGCLVSELVMVGDAINDLDGARQAGARFIGRAAVPGAFPAGTTVIPDLTSLAAVLASL